MTLQSVRTGGFFVEKGFCCAKSILVDFSSLPGIEELARLIERAGLEDLQAIGRRSRPELGDRALEGALPRTLTFYSDQAPAVEVRSSVPGVPESTALTYHAGGVRYLLECIDGRVAQAGAFRLESCPSGDGIFSRPIADSELGLMADAISQAVQGQPRGELAIFLSRNPMVTEYLKMSPIVLPEA